MKAISVLAIKGNHLARAAEIFSSFKYADLKKDLLLESWEETRIYLWQNVESLSENDTLLRAIWTDGRGQFIAIRQ